MRAPEAGGLTPGTVLVGALVVVILLAGALYMRALWTECRAHGHSWWYCAKVVTR